MSDRPENASISEDGEYWWDEGGQSWEKIEPAKPEDVNSEADLTAETLAKAQEIQAKLDSNAAFQELASLDVDAMFNDYPDKLESA